MYLFTDTASATINKHIKSLVTKKTGMHCQAYKKLGMLSVHLNYSPSTVCIKFVSLYPKRELLSMKFELKFN